MKGKIIVIAALGNPRERNVKRSPCEFRAMLWFLAKCLLGFLSAYWQSYLRKFHTVSFWCACRLHRLCAGNRTLVKRSNSTLLARCTTCVCQTVHMGIGRTVLFGLKGGRADHSDWRSSLVFKKTRARAANLLAQRLIIRHCAIMTSQLRE